LEKIGVIETRDNFFEYIGHSKEASVSGTNRIKEG
jgi:hypothetical protein